MGQIYEKQTGPVGSGPVTTAVAARSDLANVLRLQPLRTLGDVEFDVVTLGEAPEALGLGCREVDEHVRARPFRDKARALRVVDPLHLTLSHICSNLCNGARPRTGSTQATAVLGRAQTKIRETYGPRGSADSR